MVFLKLKEYKREIENTLGVSLHGESNIREDWNFAYDRASARFVTIAHQDDLYQKDYVKKLLESYEKYPDMTLFTGGYTVIRGNRPAVFEMVEFIKRFLRIPLRFRSISHLSWVKKSVLMFGNSICCPAWIPRKCKN